LTTFFALKIRGYSEASNIAGVRLQPIVSLARPPVVITA